MRIRVALAAIAAVTGAAGCSTGGTGPATNVTGAWSLNGTLTSGADTIVISGVTMTLVQTGSTFSGGYSGGHFTCIQPDSPPYDCSPGSTSPSSGSNGAIIDRQVSGSSVTFDMDDTSEPFSGTLSGGSMAGTVATPYLQQTYVGAWTATKN